MKYYWLATLWIQLPFEISENCTAGACALQTQPTITITGSNIQNIQEAQERDLRNYFAEFPFIAGKASLTVIAARMTVRRIKSLSKKIIPTQQSNFLPLTARLQIIFLPLTANKTLSLHQFAC